MFYWVVSISWTWYGGLVDWLATVLPTKEPNQSLFDFVPNVYIRYRVWMTSLWCHVGILPRLQRVINSVIMYDPHASYQQSQSRNTCYVLILSNTCSSIYIPNRRSYGFTAYYNHPHLMQAILRTVAVWAVSTVAKYLQSQLACVIRCDIVGAVAWQHCTNPAVIG